MKKGWCPNLTNPMPAADGLLLRINPIAGRLDAAGARLMADAATRYGNGAIELTNRGNLQFRGFSEASAASFAAAMQAAGLAGDDGRVIASPLLDLDPALHRQTADLAAQLSADRPTAQSEKFLIALDGGGLLGLGDIRADLLLRAETNGWWLHLDGAGAAPVDHALIPTCVATLIEAIAQAGAARMRDLVRQQGVGPLFARCGLIPAAPPVVVAPQPIGFLDYADGRGAFGLGLAFGAMNGAMLRHIADLAIAYGDGTIRLTPWRALLLPGVARRSIAALANAAPFITDPADPQRAIAACVGNAGCAAATTDTRADAAWLAGQKLGLDVHISGCAKGCAHSAPAPLTLVGNAGRYDIVRDGRAQDPPIATGLTREAVVAWLRVAA